jgi:competence protein ComEA
MQQWKEYFVFTRRERSGILVLISLILVLLVTPHFFPRKPDILKQARWIEIEQELDRKEDSTVSRRFAENFDENDTGTVVETRLFYFDPNHADENEWRQLGIKPRTIQTIKKYIARGGRFKSAQDLSKIYGLSKEDYVRLLPYVLIKKQEKAYARHDTQTHGREYQFSQDDSPGIRHRHHFSKEFLQSQQLHKSKPSQVRQLEINTADSLAFVALPGIGPKLASRILNFRNRLGGFHSVQQVAEVYGLPDSTFQLIQKYLHCTGSDLRRISLNAATLEELKEHPYIKWKLASAIIEYRNQHGPYKTVEDILKIAALESETFNKIKPYLSL